MYPAGRGCWWRRPAEPAGGSRTGTWQRYLFGLLAPRGRRMVPHGKVSPITLRFSVISWALLPGRRPLTLEIAGLRAELDQVTAAQRDPPATQGSGAGVAAA